MQELADVNSQSFTSDSDAICVETSFRNKKNEMSVVQKILIFSKATYCLCVHVT